jgi:HK97 gp10 family phage protein
MPIRVTVDKRALRNLIAALPARVDAIARRGAEQTAKSARALVPVRTGALRASIRAERTPGGYAVRAGGGAVDYAAYVEFGTRRMAAQPYLRPALESVQWERIARVAISGGQEGDA